MAEFVTHHLLWLAVTAALVAPASALITAWVRRRHPRRDKAEELLDALARYSEWLAAQRRGGEFQGERPGQVLALEDARLLALQWFPELSSDVVELLAVHNRVIDFLWAQFLLRLRDPEAWMDSEHDARFMALWRQHGRAIHQLANQLRACVGGPLDDAQPESVFPA